MTELTVVVPVAGRWGHLERCLRALIRHTDPDRHRIVVIIDLGPHADRIEQLVRPHAEWHSHISIHRNERKLGLAESCNRAVSEFTHPQSDILFLDCDVEVAAGAIDEMHAVLHLAEHHGVVGARTGDLTLATIPSARRAGASVALTGEEAEAIADAIRSDLPRYTIAPTTAGSCFLVRRSVLDNHGLFAGDHGMAYQEIDFCMRINALGYSAIFANRAYARRVGDKSAGDLVTQLDAREYRLVCDRYPHYPVAVAEFIRFGYDAVDRFAEVIAALPRTKPSVLIDLHHLSLVHNGSTRYALAGISQLVARAGDDVRVTVVAQRSVIDFFNLGSIGVRVVAYGELTEVFDVGVALAPVNDISQLAHLNRHAARWVVAHFDMIASRVLQLALADPLRRLVVGRALQYADQVVALSESGLRDAAAFYPSLAARLEQRGDLALLGAVRSTSAGERKMLRTFDRPVPAATAVAIERGGYVVIMGNAYPHKQVAPAVRALQDSGIPLIAFGPLDDVETGGDIHVLSSGVVSDEQLSEILRRASVMVFPSAYEGYGLSIADSLDHGTPVVVYDTPVAREVVAGLDGADAVRFFSRFADLPEVVRQAVGDRALARAASQHRNRVAGLEDHYEHVWQYLLTALATPVDRVALRRRYENVESLDRVAAEMGRRVAEFGAVAAFERARVEEALSSRTYRVGSMLARAGSPLLRLARRWRRAAFGGNTSNPE